MLPIQNDLDSKSTALRYRKKTQQAHEKAKITLEASACHTESIIDSNAMPSMEAPDSIESNFEWKSSEYFRVKLARFTVTQFVYLFRSFSQCVRR